MRDRPNGRAGELIVRLAMAVSCATPAFAVRAALAHADEGCAAPAGPALSLCSPAASRARASWMTAQLGSGAGSRDAAPELPLDPGAAPEPGPEGPGGPPMRGLEWTLAPVRWGGNVSYEVRRLGVAGHAPRLQQVETASLRGASYVWQPWFIQVSGGLGIVAGRERSRTETDGAGAADSSSNTVTGSAAVSVFPASRFPFQATYDKTDSRASGEITRDEYTNTRWGLRQNWRSPPGDLQYTGSWDRGTLESSTFGRDTVDVLAAGFARITGPQTWDVSGSRARNWRGDTGESSLIERLVARHGYRPDPLSSVDTLASATSSKFELLANGSPAENRTRFNQASTFATWRPEQGSPLYLAGGGRVFKSIVDVNGAVSEADTLSGNLSANYALSRHTNLSGAVAVTHVSTDTTSDTITTESAAATYVPDAIPVAGYLYTWNTGVNVGNQTGGATGAEGRRSRQNAGGQLGHNLTRSSPLGEASSLTYGAGQSYSSTWDTVTERSSTLTHSASVSANTSPAPSSTAFASLFGADSRTRGHNENTFQLVNFQVNGQVQFTRYSLGAANLTVQGVRQGTPATPASGFNTSSGGNVTYQHLRAFDVPRLRYSAIYGANQTQYSSRLEGDINAPRERITRSFEQRLDWSVGRLDMQLTARTATIDGQRNDLVFFRVNRQFGAF